MARLTYIQADQATGKTEELFAAIKRALGKVPNAYLTIGTHSPQALAQALQHNGQLAKSSLNAREREAINLAVSEASRCDYCLAAHTLAAKAAGYTAEQARQLRQGSYPEDAHIDALVKFVTLLVTTRGDLAQADVSAFRAADFSDRQLVDTISAVSAILFTNMFNRVNATELDFPPAD